MSLYLQIALPVLATLVALIAIAAIRKYIKVETVVIGLILLGIGTYTAVMYFTLPKAVDNVALTDSDVLSLLIAEECILAEQYDDALNILNEIQITEGNAGQISLNVARCLLLKGNYSAAAKAYGNLVSVGESEKNQALALYSSTQNRDNAVIHYLTANGHNPDDYGLQPTPVATGNIEAARSEINESVISQINEKKKAHGEQLAESAKQSANVISLFNDYLKNGYHNGEITEDALDDLLDCIKERPELAKNPHLRNSRLLGRIMLGQYVKIARDADEYSTAEELIVLAELYVKKLIDEGDFSDGYAITDKEALEEMLELCREALEENKSKLPAAHYEKYRQELASVEDRTHELALFTLKHRLLDFAQNGDVTMSSKGYLALAKIEHYYKNDELADIYLSEAFGTAPDSDDENYRKPMVNLVSILEGTDDDVKSIAEYVDDALDNSLPARVTPPESSAEDADGFKNHVTDTVSQGTATVNIGVIEKDGFPTVKARVQLQSDLYTTEDELRENVRVYDCGSEITDFTLERLEFTSSNILLLCDVSGSMSGSVGSLKNAIVSFADNMSEGERVSVVGFDDSVTFVHEFTFDPEKVKEYGESVCAGGGTNLFGALLEAGKYFNYDVSANNIIIAMTDGVDGYSHSETEIYGEIGKMVSEKGITVYTLGLGNDVDEKYLEVIASAGNGSFLYVDNDAGLDSFYSFIHGQLSNQYVLTYTAKNQTLNTRKLELSLNNVMGGNAEKTYYLVEPENEDADLDAYNPYRVEDGTLSVNGLTTKFLYKSSVDNTVSLVGKGFDSGDDVTVRISGNLKYDLSASYKSDTAYEIVIPSEIAAGTYDLTVSIRNESVTLEDELTIAVQGSEKSLRFGAYSFTALSSYANERGETVLSGNVVMNGWLHFKGDVVLSHHYDDTKVYITDNSGAYVSYSGTDAVGLAKQMGDSGVSFSLGALGQFSLSSLPYSPDNYEDFTVGGIEIDGASVLYLSVESPRLYIYPDMLLLQGGGFDFELPFQKQLMRGFDVDTYSAASFDSEMLITANKICMTARLDYSGTGEDACFTMVSLPLSVSDFSVSIDTLRNDYSIDAIVKIKALKDMEGIKFSFGVKDGRFDSIGLAADGAEIPLTTTPIPVSMGDFGFSVSGFSDKEQDDSVLEQVLDSDVSFDFKVEVASLNHYLPDIAELISDEEVSLATLDNCRVTAKLRDFRLAFNADVVLLTVFDLGKCEVELGKFDYTNYLIGYNEVTECGLRAELSADLSCDLPNLDLSLKGAEEITIGYPYSGMWFSGTADFDVAWWLLRTDYNVKGDALVGVYVNSADKLQFSLMVRGVNSEGERSGFNISITEADGFDIHKY